MKKYLALILIANLALNSCKREDALVIVPPIPIEEQNANDDAALQNFLQNNTFSDKGTVIPLNDEAKKANRKALTEYQPVRLPSGVIYLHYYQPDAKNLLVKNTDAVTMQFAATTYLSGNANGAMNLTQPMDLSNTLTGGGIARQDPYFYYFNPAQLAAGLSKSYYEIEGLAEAMVNFRTCNINMEDDYKMQGLILVPSRAAYARDDHYRYNNINWNNRSLVFNFQIYKTEARK